MNPVVLDPEFHFIRTYWLWALIPACLLVVLLLKNKLQEGQWSQVCDPELLPYILQQKPGRQSRWFMLALSLATVLVIIALAGPAWQRLPSPAFRNDSALVIALDLSRSMHASDIKPSRLVRARYKINDILNQRKDGQTALLVYAGDAFVVTPLTNDVDTISSQLPALSPEIMPSQGSRTDLALQQAKALFKQSGLQKGHILLVTDEVDFAQVEDSLKEMTGYQISVLAVGTAEGAPIKLAQGGFLKDANGNIVIPKLDQSALVKLALNSGGIHKVITADDSDIKQLAAFFDQSPAAKTDQDNTLYLDQWQEQGPWLLLLVLPLAALSFRKGFLVIGLLMFLPYPKNSYAMDWQDLWQSSDQQGQKAYQAGNYQQAAEQFTTPEWKAAAQYKAGAYDQVVETLKDVKTADSFYNQGNALAQMGKLQESIEAYEQSLKLNPDNADAKANKEVVEKELEKQKQQQQNQQQNSGQNSEQDNSKQSEGESDPDQSQQQKGQQPEQGEQSDQGQEQQQDNQQQSDNTSEQQQEQDQAQPEQTNKEENDQQQDEQPAASAQEQELDESEQASEQWLKRIPDDPAGLLRRKFKYQYGQRKRQSTNDKAW